MTTLAGKTILITGDFQKRTPYGRLKRDPRLDAHMHGATLVKTVSEGVDFVVKGFYNPSAAHLKKASSLGIRILDEDNFIVSFCLSYG